MLPHGGWKAGRKNRSFCEDAIDSNDTLGGFGKCLQESIHTFNETVISCNRPYYRDFILGVGGPIHIIKPIKVKRFLINLNPKFDYFIGFTDTKFLMTSSNPSTLPYILRNVHPNSGHHIIYLKVSLALFCSLS